MLVGPKGSRIQPSDGGGTLSEVWRRLLAVIMKVGQQSLAIFITSMFLARLMGALLDQVGRNHFSMFWVNLLGATILVGVAYSVAWIKTQPWKPRKTANAAS